MCAFRSRTLLILGIVMLQAVFFSNSSEDSGLWKKVQQRTPALLDDLQADVLLRSLSYDECISNLGKANLHQKRQIAKLVCHDPRAPDWVPTANNFEDRIYRFMTDAATQEALVKDGKIGKYEIKRDGLQILARKSESGKHYLKVYGSAGHQPILYAVAPGLKEVFYDPEIARQRLNSYAEEINKIVVPQVELCSVASGSSWYVHNNCEAGFHKECIDSYSASIGRECPCPMCRKVGGFRVESHLYQVKEGEICAICMEQYVPPVAKLDKVSDGYRPKRGHKRERDLGIEE